MESFKQLKRNMMWAFENRKDIPQDVTGQIQNMFNSLEEKYREKGCYSDSIEQYMQQNIEELVDRLERGIGDKRKDKQYEDIQAFLLEVERDAEQKLEGEEKKIKNAERQWKISEIGNNTPNNIGITLNSMDQIIDSLKDVQSKQNKILTDRGLYGNSKIEEMNDEMQNFIMQLRSTNEEEIHQAFIGDNAELRKELLQAYEQYSAE